MSARLPGPRGPLQQLRVGVGFQRRPHETLLRFVQEYGPVAAFGFGRYRYVLVSGAEANEYVLHTNPAAFRWREAFWALAIIDGDTALVVSDGADHQRRRAIVQPAFHRKRISTYFDAMVEETSRTLEAWRPGTTVDAYAELRRTVLSIVLRCLFDGALGAHEPEFVDRMHLALDYANRSPLQRIDKPWFGPYRKATKARAEMDAIVFDVIGKRRSEGERRDDILGWLIEAQDDGRQLNDQEVRDQVISLIAAAYDTTSSVAGWIAMRLADDPSLATALRAEVASVAGEAALTIDHLPQLRLTAAVVNEVLRMHPPALIAPRYIAQSFDLHGHHVEAGGMLMYSTYVTHMDPEQFPEPSVFTPTRWLEGDPDHRAHHPYAFVPFGGGSRRCIGFAFALQELTVMTALLAQRDLTPMYTAPPKPEGIASMAPKCGVPVRVG